MAYDLAAATAKIRADAKKYGIDPEIAVKVARSEGLGGGIYQSNVMKNGMREPSFGPFQLLVGDGQNFPKGMGNDFMAKTGLDPSDPSTVDAQIDFALSHAAQNGWGAWYGAKAAGVGNRQGIPGSPQAYAGDPKPTGAAAAINENFNLGSGGDTEGTGLAYDPAGPKQSRRIGGLGGIGGYDPGPEPDPFESVSSFLKSEQFGDVLGSLGAALIAGDGRVFSQALNQRQERRDARDERQERRRWQEATFGAQQANEDRDYALRKRQADLQAEIAGRKGEGYRTLSADEAARMGLPPGAAYQVGPDNKVDAIGKSGVTINTGDNSSKFQEKTDEAAAKRLGDIVEAGNGASQMLGDVQQLADLGRTIGTGKGAQVLSALGPYADALGFKLDGLDETQAYNSIIARMAPNMRPAGSGASSDFDARQFLTSLPGLGNTQGGNEIITDTFQAIQNNKMDAAEIASRATLPKENGGITWQEAEKQIRQLPNPYERFKAFRSKPNDPPPVGDAPPPPTGAPAPANTGGNWPQGGQVARPRSAAELNALPRGTMFVAPDGTTRRKP
ncbi:hypothetical protein [Aureimonas psammosilenae]|uniref:hypothetical protein n=1 Tax=Aureimonas psammosilenae TaxID=2495496 RepID=UPI001260E868|nr:hypothetical protein [Aureimonas psammosilenae]